MSAATKPEQEPGTSVAAPSETGKRIDGRVAALRERNELVRQIRGTQWGKDVTEAVARAVAHYCNENGLDAVRHVELLGGRIYLTGTFYEERGAPLLLSGQVQKAEPDFINADARLDTLAANGDAWAVEESTRRIRERIKHGVPESATAAVVQRFQIASGGTVVGVNWCGDRKNDPVGNAEPSKTAITRATRRGWKQIAEVIPGYGAQVKPVEARARVVSEELPVSVVDAPHASRPLITSGTNGYDEAPIPPAQHSDNPSSQAEDFEDSGELALGEERRAPAKRRNAIAEP